MAAGDHEEHANLLAGYFLYARRQVPITNSQAATHMKFV